MQQLSKINKLGVIVLATKFLERLKIPVPRIISSAADGLGVSRKAGYQAAVRIVKSLTEGPETVQREEDLLRENFLQRIQIQVLRFERDHPKVRFSQRGKHLPAHAKSLCVRILRDFKEKIPLSHIAEAIGVSDATLSRWHQEARPDCRFPAKPEQRGSHRHAKPQDAKQVLEVFNELEEEMSLEEFTQHYNTLHPHATLDRKTITRILQAAGLHKPEPKSEQKAYHGEVKVYFPGAQVGIDGKQTEIHFTGQPEESITLTKEVAVDVATGTILGDALRKHEDAEGVKTVVIKARKECETLLAVLADNRSSNTAAEAQKTMEGQSELGPIYTFPYHARTNGHVENLFSQFSRMVGPIAIDDTSRQRIAESVHELVWRLFIHHHNYSPCVALGFKSRREYLRTYAVLPRELEEARKGLRDQQKRSRENRGPHPRLSDRVFCQLVARIIKEHQFKIGKDKALESLVHFDQRVIESAGCAFSAYSNRDGFDERKRHFAYFMGIVRKKQKEVDQARRESAADVMRTQRLFDENAAHNHEIEEEKRQEKRDLKTQPELVILKYADLLMRGRFRWMRRTCLLRIREGLRALCRVGSTRTQLIEHLAFRIRSMPDFAEELKDHMVKLLVEEIEELTGTVSTST